MFRASDHRYSSNGAIDSIPIFVRCGDCRRSRPKKPPRVGQRDESLGFSGALEKLVNHGLVGLLTTAGETAKARE